jgi:nucleoid-associated protein YgaU
MKNDYIVDRLLEEISLTRYNNGTGDLRTIVECAVDDAGEDADELSVGDIIAILKEAQS